MKDAGSIYDIRATVFVSCIVHACFFAAVIISSSYIMKSRMIMPDENILFVYLGRDTADQDEKRGLTVEKQMPRDAAPPKKKEVRTVKKKQVEAMRHDVQELPAEESAVMKGPVDKGNSPATEPAHSLVPEGPSKDIGPGTGLRTEGSMRGTSDISDAPASGPQKRASRSGQTGGDLSPDILRRIEGAIEKAKTYPPVARRRGMEGTVFVSFKISEDGTPRELLVLKSSGFDVLDAATIDAIRKAGPYPRVHSRIEVPIAYRLNQ